MQQYSTFMPGPVAPPQVPNPTYSATTPWGRGKEMEQAAILAATVGNSPMNHIIKQNQQQQRMVQPLPDPVQISNLWGLLGQLGSLEIPPH